MNRGLRPIVEAIEIEGCPLCGEQPVGIQIDGPQDIRLTCGHLLDAKRWADEQYEKHQSED